MRAGQDQFRSRFFVSRRCLRRGAQERKGVSQGNNKNGLHPASSRPILLASDCAWLSLHFEIPREDRGSALRHRLARRSGA
jgi:hypothetical protein